MFQFSSLTAALFAVLLAVTPATAQTPASPVDPQALLVGFNSAWHDERLEDVVDFGSRLTAHPVFPAQPESFRHSIHLRLGFGFARRGRDEDALAQYALAESLADDPSLTRYWRYFQHVRNERWLDAYRDLAALDDARATLFQSLSVRQVGRLFNELRDAGETAAHRDFIVRIIERYEPENPFVTMDYMRAARIRHLIEDGDVTGAARLAGEIGAPRTLQTLRSERAFEPLWTRDVLPDLRGAVEASLARTDALIELHPRHLLGRRSRMEDLMALGRFEEAEAEGRAVSDDLAEGVAYEDAEDDINWLLNTWSYALYALGRLDEGNAVMARAAGLDEQGSANVSQTINYAAMLVYQGRPHDALDMLAHMEEGSASPYGMMWVRSVHACAYQLLGDAPARDAELGRLAEAWDDNPSAYQRALICAERTEESAALMIRRLQDEDHRSGAIAALQIMQPLLPMVENAVRWQDALDALSDRPDVRAALDAVGRVERHDVVDSYWGNF